eukprot:858822-Ditylum_brightwellii.AAC.1
MLGGDLGFPSDCVWYFYTYCTLKQWLVPTSGSDTEWTPMDTSSPVQATSIDGAQLWVLMHK